MKFELGDTVVVKHSDEEGRVIDIINDKMVMVEVRGVKFPAYVDQLDFPYYKRFTEKKLFPPKTEKKFIEEVRKEKKIMRHADPDGVWIIFLPKFAQDEFGDEYVTELRIHLQNTNADKLGFVYRLNFLAKAEWELTSELQPHEDFYVHTVPFDDFNDSPAFSVVFSLKPPKKGKADHWETALKIRPKQLFDRIEKLKESGDASFRYQLFQTYPDKIVDPGLDMSKLTARGMKVYDAKRAHEFLPSPRSVVDLHIEKLTNKPGALSPAEMLDLQLREATHWLDIAIAHKQQHLVLIHGIGEGKLRHELHEMLRQRKGVKSFVNAFHPSYGWGATEVFMD